MISNTIAGNMNIILMVRIATSADRAEGKHGTESSR